MVFFCPKCGKELVESSSEVKSCQKKVQFSLPSFTSYKAKKESKRGEFRFRNKAKSRIEETQVTIQVGVMKEKHTVKRGETLPLKALLSDITSSEEKAQGF